MKSNLTKAAAILVAISISSPGFAMTAEEKDSIFWQQFGFGIGGGILTGGGAALGVYYLCDANDVDWDSATGTLCFAGMIISGVLGLMTGTATAVWGVGEYHGLDGSWTSSFAGAAIGTLLSIPIAPLAPVGASVGATYFYGNSHTQSQTLEPTPLTPQPVPQSIIPLLRFSF